MPIIYMCVYIYMYTHICICIYTHIYTNIIALIMQDFLYAGLCVF